MSWIDAVGHLRERREPGVLVTLMTVRGHAPREAGAKMVVAAQGQWGTIGGGNLEASALAAARAMLTDHATALHATPPSTLTQELTDHAESTFGRQCCGGTATVLLEPLPVPASVAIFGMGHVGREIARILARHDLELHLVDAREAHASPDGIPGLDDALARIHWHHAPWPEPLLPELPAGTHVLVMTHDHAEDAAICDAALRCDQLASIGLIGSSAKWRRIEKVLREWGHAPAATNRITTPIGDPRITGKEPATIALSVVVDLLARLTQTAPVQAAVRP
jgi:xanthine dehydrogenase accessory factor